MRSGRTRHPWAIVLGAVVVSGLWTKPIWSQDAAQPAAKPAVATDNELEPVVAKIREGRAEEALALIKEKSAMHPEWPPSHLILAKLLFGANQVAAGRRALEQAAAYAPDHPDVYLTLGELALSEGRLSDARLNFENALKLSDSLRGDPDKIRAGRCTCLAGLATVNEAREDWKGAEARLNAWLALEPKQGRARQRLGRALFLLDKAESAFAALTQGVKDDPSLEPAAVSMALLYARKGDAKKAGEWFDYARKLEPKSARVRYEHATWLLEQGRAQDARAEIDEAVKLEPGSKDVQKIQGLIAWHLHDLAGAEKIFELINRDSPADPLAANMLALVLVEQDDRAKRERGRQLAEVNTVQFPRSHEALATLGWALYQTGRPELAEEKLRAAVSGARITADIAYFLARVLVDNSRSGADKGKTDDARKLLETTTKQPGAFAHREDAVALLKSLSK
jgi:Tfp pilus assembly protein PilF